MYACICKSVTDTQIHHADKEGACSMCKLCQTLDTCPHVWPMYAGKTEQKTDNRKISCI